MMGRAALATLLAIAIVAPAAQADFTPPSVISGSSTVESDYAFDPVIAADGRYVAFAGSQTGVIGIYRKDLQTRQLDLVAAGDGAAPSISADGRYISFTTTATDPSTGNGSQCSSVWVRDMSLPIDLPGAFTLASALDGAPVGLTYAGSSIAGCPGGGSSAASRVALSWDGRRVAFTVVGSSNLITGVGGPPSAPPAQVVVRDLATQSTTLVSQTIASLGSSPAAPVPGGAAMTDNSTGPGSSPDTTNAAPGDSTASISADGSTVAWLGIDIPQQAPADPSADAPQFHRANEYDEPLWRRIADGPGAPIRRIIGGDDPVGPCAGAVCAGPLDTQWHAPFDQTTGDTGPERGSFIAPNNGFDGANTTIESGLADVTPQLSADGRTVAILSTQPATGQDPVFSQGTPQNVSANAFVVNMAPGLNRDQALTRVTEWASDNFGDFPLAGPIEKLAISPDGNRLAFVTQRTQFPYSPPALITPQLTDVGFKQLYVADLNLGTLQLASTGYDGQPANNIVDSPSFSAGNGPISFSSSATNLVYGAFTSFPAGSEVFTITELQPPSIPGGQNVGPAPPNPPIIPDWVISTTVSRHADGTVYVYASVPGPGRATADARASVPKTVRRRTRRHNRRIGRVTRKTLARSAASSRAAGTLTLRLVPPARYSRLIARRHGIYATITVRFRAAGHRTLTQTLAVDFRRATKRMHSKGRGR